MSEEKKGISRRGLFDTVTAASLGLAAASAIHAEPAPQEHKPEPIANFKYNIESERGWVGEGGSAKEATVAEFPISQSIAGVSMRLKPGAIRELHWHALAAEWAYMLEGRCRATVVMPNGQSEMLIALGADGGSKAAEQLSKGARFQLYLALRVAGYHELAKVRVPAPFIADDIMETFDHFRAEEALRLLAEMGRVGQVIYFTHHLHLAEIAKRICPEARVHELTA